MYFICRAETDGATSGERGEDEGHGNIAAFNDYVLGSTNRNYTITFCASSNSTYDFAFCLKMLILSNSVFNAHYLEYKCRVLFLMSNNVCIVVDLAC